MTFKIKRNDRKPPITVRLTEDGVAIPLAGCTVKFIMKASGAAAAKVDAVASIVDENAGEVTYEWGETDTDTSGKFRAEWEITDAAGLKRTVPNDGYDYVEVIEDLA